MKTSESKITAKGQISVPAAVRQQLSLVPGARIEWLKKNGEVVVRRASRYTSEDIHTAVFSQPFAPVSVAEMDAGIRDRMKNRHARD